MIIEIGDNGLRSRYEWRSHEVPSDDPAEAAYQAIRLRCPWLTDENHTWKARDYRPMSENASVPERKLKEYLRSSRYSIVIEHVENIGPFGMKFWFSMAYRVPGQPH